MDLFWTTVCLLPILLGHFITIWGNYFRASSQFQHSISKVTTPASEKQRISIWERHDSRFGFTVKFWCLASLIVVMNIYWFVLTTVMSRADYVSSFGVTLGNVRAIAYGGSQALLLDTSIILFLVLRRSMLHALGFTYPEIIPLHRWLGVAMFIWATIHAFFYGAYYIIQGTFWANIAFTDKTRGTRNMPGVFAWFGIIVMAFFALPRFRRWVYPVFLYVHRAGTFVFFIGLVMHYPSMMIWYYMLPGFILFLLDRFVPKIIQARSIDPAASCALNADADIIRVKFTSPEPMKPYYPGDYITVQVPGLGNVHHPFTIASYWPEDPYSITLYMRVFGESKMSWTKALAARCGTDDKGITIRTNVDGVFGDRRHDYLKSETMVIFVAGAAITTFMALIKAIAAQIAVSNNPLRMKLHLICTFRTRSELHAYGSFLHQITRDPRFTSWLHVEIYVSRPDKPNTLMGAHAHVIKNDIQVPGQTKKKDRKNFLQRTGTKLKRALSGRTMVNVPAPTMTAVVVNDEKAKAITSLEDTGLQRSNSANSTTMTIAGPSSPTSLSSEEPLSDKPTKSMTYKEHALPTFEAASADSVSKKLALFDLLTSALLAAIPLAFYYGMRSVHFEGDSQWCLTAKAKDKWTIFVCQWTYALVPGLVHTVVMLALGYTGIFVARKVHVRHHKRANGQDVESTAAAVSTAAVQEEKQSVTDGNWDDGDVVYSRGRMDVRKVINSFVDQGVGKKENGQGLATVFAGGPEGFVGMIERQVQKASWSVEFHRETWAP
ncbi:ferric reductase like transmembrane component-domain-containing protein [Gamsiella multidivaricata]|uniref:ferric reductase like transmembrane component-domain-containing protein n=1 Tax=Gamsiella multidivaricata TaxID=101098 RepID=UPI00221EFCA2|nr:ferric reductase like transmembrane component-domain-containing protein [Gamsiella multidivaricata]KAI7832267.1 ferric reductase like transmembrane component-domain-containing protein [Gamsiella multidivaricata]